MPPKTARNKPSTASAVPAKASCCICCQSVKPDKDEVLFCTGGCQQWLHRYCASVSVDGYKSMKSDNSPFLCFCCYRSRKEEQLSTLEKTVQELKAELSELRKRFPAVPPREASQPADNINRYLRKPTHLSQLLKRVSWLLSLLQSHFLRDITLIVNSTLSCMVLMSAPKVPLELVGLNLTFPRQSLFYLPLTAPFSLSQ